MTKSSTWTVIVALVILNVTMAAMVAMGFSVKRIEYALFYRPYVEAELNRVYIDMEELKKMCFSNGSLNSRKVKR